MINSLFQQLPENINITVTKKDLFDLFSFCQLQNQYEQKKDFSEHLNMKQLSEYINYSEPAIYKMVSQAEIPCYKISGKLLFKRKEIDNWLLSFKQSTISERVFNLAQKGGKAK